MDEQNQNPYGMNETQDPYGTNGAPDPYGTGAPQNPYGTNGAPNPYGTGAPQNPYGTTGVPNPYGTGVPQAPYGAAPQPPKPPKKKMSKKAKILIFGGIGLAAVAAAVILLCIYVFFPAKKTVEKAMQAMANGDNLFSQSVLGSELGIDALVKSFSEEGGEVIADLTLAADVTSSADKTLGIGADVALDKTAKQLSGTFKLNYSGKDLLDAHLFSDENQTSATIKDLMKGYLTINNKGVISSLKNSPLITEDTVKQALGMIPDFDLNFFGGMGAGLTANLFSDDNEMWKDSKVSREGSETLYAGDISVSAKKYSVTIPKEKLQEMVGKAVDQGMEALTNANVSIPGLSGLNLSAYGTQLKTIIQGIFKDDLVYYVYIKDDKVVSVKANLSLALMTYNIKADLDFTSISADSKNVTKFKAVLDMMGQTIDVDLNISTKEEGGAYNTTASLSATALGKTLASGSYEQTYNKADQTIQGSGSYSITGNATGKISVSGKVAEIDKGKLLKFSFDDISIELPNNGKSVHLSGDLTIKAKSAGLQIQPVDSSKPNVNLSTANKDQIKTVIDTESEEFKKFVEQFKNIGN